jgi:hypothetical protein
MSRMKVKKNILKRHSRVRNGGRAGLIAGSEKDEALRDNLVQRQPPNVRDIVLELPEILQLNHQVHEVVACHLVLLTVIDGLADDAREKFLDIAVDGADPEFSCQRLEGDENLKHCWRVLWMLEGFAALDTELGVGMVDGVDFYAKGDGTWGSFKNIWIW